jgi:hypothetical protein
MSATKNNQQSPRKSIFVEHMNDEVPGYGQSAKIMNSLLTLQDYVQTGSNGKIDDCSHLFEDVLSQDDILSVPSLTKTNSASRAVSSPFQAPEKRETFSKIKDAFKPKASSSATREGSIVGSTAKSTRPAPAERKFSMASFSSLRGSIRRR